jgi:CBS domain-containing protein
MTLTLASLQSLRRVFRHSFSVHDITEPLVSCEQFAEAREVRAFMERRKFEVVGVRKEGLVIGYVERSALGDGLCSEYVQPFSDEEVILDTASLADVVLGLRDSARLFVSVFGRVGGIVTRSDLQKAPVRMWLFGMVTIIEMRLTRMIEHAAPEEDWRRYLSEARLQKAEELLAERARRNQDLGLIDCLQFSDKCQIVARNETLRSLTRFASRRKVEEAAKKLERLRNNLAHAQDILATNWDAVVELSDNLDDLLEGPPNWHDESGFNTGP